MPPEQTIADLSGRVEIFGNVSPPEDIAAEWQTLHDLFAEAVTIAEQIPADQVVAGDRVFAIIEELEAPGEVVSDYLNAHC